MPALDSSGTARKGGITIFWAFAGLFTILFLTAAGMPISDYARREALVYMKEPTQQNFDRLHAKHNEEVRKHWLYALPAGASRRSVCDSALSRLSEKNKSAGLKPCTTKSISTRGFYLTTRKGPMARTSVPEQ